MTASARNHAQMQWYMADPLVTEETAPLLASAFSLDTDEITRTYALTRLTATDEGVRALEAITAAFSGDGNSYFQRRMRAMRQRRDRLGRFAEEGGGMRSLLRLADGSVHWLTGRSVGADPNSNTFDIETPRGIVRIPAGSAEGIEAYLPGQEGPDGVSPAPAKISSADESDVISEADLQIVDAPSGWEPVENFKGNQGEKAFTDGTYTVAQTTGEDGKNAYRLIDENGTEISQSDSWAKMLDDSMTDALGTTDRPELPEDMLLSGLDEIAKNDTAGSFRDVASDIAEYIRTGKTPEGETPEQLADRAAKIGEMLKSDKSLAPEKKSFETKFEGFQDDFERGAKAIRAKLEGSAIQQQRKEDKLTVPVARLPKEGGPVSVPAGMHELDRGEYIPEGYDGQESPDYTDDPAQLARKFDQATLKDALREGIVDGSGESPLEFSESTEYPPAEALYHALKNQGVNVDAFVDSIYKGTDKGPTKAVLPEDQGDEDLIDIPDIPEEDIPLEDIADGADIADIFAKAIDTPEVSEVKPLDGNPLTNEDHDKTDDFEEGTDEVVPALIDGLTDEEKQAFADGGFDHTPFLPANEDIQLPDGYYQMDPAPVALDEFTTVEEGDELNQSGIPIGWSDDPYFIAVGYETQDLIDSLAYALEPRDEDSEYEAGYAPFSATNEDGEDVTIQVRAEIFRDALQLQGEDTNDIVQRISDEAFASLADKGEIAPDVVDGQSSNDPSEEEIRRMMEGEGIPSEEPAPELAPEKQKVDNVSTTEQPVGEPNAERASRLNARADELAAAGKPARAAVYRLRGQRDGEGVRLYSPTGEGNVSLPVGDVEAVNTFEPSDEAKSIMQDGGITPLTMHELTPNAENAAIFHQAITDAKNANEHGASVYVYSPEEYAGMRMFVSADGKSGFALKGNDLVSVFKGDTTDKRVAHAMVPLAIQEGATTADAFDTTLPEIYGDHGLKTVARLPWDDSQAPDDWNKETFSESNNGEPDVVFMAYDPEDTAGYTAGQGQTFTEYGDAVDAQNVPTAPETSTSAYTPSDTRQTIPFDTLTYDEAQGKAVPSSGESQIIDFGGRKIVVMDINGTKVPFYLSTGNGGKKDVAAGKWYPFFGVSEDGWLNKTGGADINNYYDSPELRAQAEWLDANIGDIRDDNTIPKVKGTGSHMDFINQDLNPGENGTPTTIADVTKNIEDTKAKISQPSAVDENATPQAPEEPSAPVTDEQTPTRAVTWIAPQTSRGPVNVNLDEVDFESLVDPEEWIDPADIPAGSYDWRVESWDTFQDEDGIGIDAVLTGTDANGEGLIVRGGYLLNRDGYTIYPERRPYDTTQEQATVKPTPTADKYITDVSIQPGKDGSGKAYEGLVDVSPVEDDVTPTPPVAPAKMFRGDIPTRDLQPGDVTVGDNFTITEVGTELIDGRRLSVKGYYPGHPIQEKQWKPDTPIPVVRGIAPEQLPASGDLPELHKPSFAGMRGGRNNKEYLLEYAKYRGALNAARERWSGKPDVAKSEFDPTKDTHRVKLSAQDLQPGDVSADPAKGHFVITSVTEPDMTNPDHANAVANDLLIVNGYYPGHEIQEKQWKRVQRTPMEFVRNGVVPDSGPLPKINQPATIDENGNYVRSRDPQLIREYKSKIAEASSGYVVPDNAPLVEAAQTDTNVAPVVTQGTSSPDAPLSKPKNPYLPDDPFAQGSFADLVREAGSWSALKEKLAGRTLVFFDYETTGFGGPNKPVQLGAVKVVDGVVVDRFNVHMNPEAPLTDWSAANLKDADGNPVTDEWLAGQGSMADAHQQFADWAGEDAILGAHKSDFDRGVLEDALNNTGVQMSPAGFINTLTMAREIHKGDPDAPKKDNGRADNTLKALTEYYGVGLGEGWHTADADSEATANLFAKMLDAADSKGLGNDLFNVDASQEQYDADMAAYQDKYNKYLSALSAYEAQQLVLKAASGEEVNIDDAVKAVQDAKPEVNPSEVNVPSTDAIQPAPERDSRLATTEWAADGANTREIPMGDIRFSEIQPNDFMTSLSGNLYQVLDTNDDPDFVESVGGRPGQSSVYRVNLETGEGHWFSQFANSRQVSGVRRPINPESLAFGDNSGDQTLTKTVSPDDASPDAPTVIGHNVTHSEFQAETTVTKNSDGSMTAVTEVTDGEGDIVAQEEQQVSSVKEAGDFGDATLEQIRNDIAELTQQFQDEAAQDTPTTESVPQVLQDVRNPTVLDTKTAHDQNGNLHEVTVSQIPSRQGGGFEVGLFKDNGNGDWTEASHPDNFTNYNTIGEAKDAARKMLESIKPVEKKPAPKPVKSIQDKMDAERANIQEGAYLNREVREYEDERGFGYENVYTWVNPDGSTVPFNPSDSVQGADTTPGRVFGQENTNVVDTPEATDPALDSADLSQGVDEVYGDEPTFFEPGTPVQGLTPLEGGTIIAPRRIVTPDGKAYDVAVQLLPRFEGSPENYQIVAVDPSNPSIRALSTHAATLGEAQALYLDTLRGMENGSIEITSDPNAGRNVNDVTPGDSSPFTVDNTLMRGMGEMRRRIIGDKRFRKWQEENNIYGDGINQSRVGDRVVHSYDGWNRRGEGTVLGYTTIQNSGDRSREAYAIVTFADGSYALWSTRMLFLNGRTQGSENRTDYVPPAQAGERPMLSPTRTQQYALTNKYIVERRRRPAAEGGGWYAKVLPYVGENRGTEIADTRRAYGMWLQKLEQINNYRREHGLPVVDASEIKLVPPAIQTANGTGRTWVRMINGERDGMPPQGPNNNGNGGGGTPTPPSTPSAPTAPEVTPEVTPEVPNTPEAPAGPQISRFAQDQAYDKIINSDLQSVGTLNLHNLSEVDDSQKGVYWTADNAPSSQARVVTLTATEDGKFRVKGWRNRDSWRGLSSADYTEDFNTLQEAADKVAKHLSGRNVDPEEISNFGPAGTTTPLVLPNVGTTPQSVQENIARHADELKRIPGLTNEVGIETQFNNKQLVITDRRVSSKKSVISWNDEQQAYEVVTDGVQASQTFASIESASTQAINDLANAREQRIGTQGVSTGGTASRPYPEMPRANRLNERELNNFKDAIVNHLSSVNDTSPINVTVDQGNALTGQRIILEVPETGYKAVISQSKFRNGWDIVKVSQEGSTLSSGHYIRSSDVLDRLKIASQQSIDARAMARVQTERTAVSSLVSNLVDYDPRLANSAIQIDNAGPDGTWNMTISHQPPGYVNKYNVEVSINPDGEHTATVSVVTPDGTFTKYDMQSSTNIDDVISEAKSKVYDLAEANGEETAETKRRKAQEKDKGVLEAEQLLNLPANPVPIYRRFLNRYLGERSPVQQLEFDGSLQGAYDPRFATPSTHQVLTPNGDPVSQKYFQDQGWEAEKAAQIAHAGTHRASVDRIVELWQRGDTTQAKRLIAEAMGKGVQFGPGLKVGNDVRVSGHLNGSGSGTIYVTLPIVSATGGNINKEASRHLTFENGKLVNTYNASMFIKGSGASGFSSLFNQYTENWYIANGSRSVTVTAAAGGFSSPTGATGGYVWAITGYNWIEPSSGYNRLKSMHNYLQNASSSDRAVGGEVGLARAKADIERAVKQGFDAYGVPVGDWSALSRAMNGGAELAPDFPTPRELAMIGWTPDLRSTDQHWFGKAYMMDNGWGGKKSLVPTATERIQNHTYDDMKKAVDKLAASGANSFENSPELKGHFTNPATYQGDGSILAPYADELTMLTGYDGTRSISQLSPPAKAALQKYLSSTLSKQDGSHLVNDGTPSGNAKDAAVTKGFVDMLDALQKDRLSFEPNRAELSQNGKKVQELSASAFDSTMTEGVGKQLVNPDTGEAMPFTITKLANQTQSETGTGPKISGPYAGASDIWKIQHDVTGEVFFVKKNPSDIQVQAEVAGNALGRSLGIVGLPVVDTLPNAGSSYMITSELGTNLSIPAINLDELTSGSNGNVELDTPHLIRMSESPMFNTNNNDVSSIADINNSLGMLVLDATLQNEDRGNHNVMMVKGNSVPGSDNTTGSWIPVPFDHADSEAVRTAIEQTAGNYQSPIDYLQSSLGESNHLASQFYDRVGPVTFKMLIDKRIEEAEKSLKAKYGTYMSQEVMDMLSDRLTEMKNYTADDWSSIYG
jgi:DNA polymerase III epsilon subunit-like protein